MRSLASLRPVLTGNRYPFFEALPLVQEALEVYCSLKKTLQKVTLEDLLASGLSPVTCERLLADGLLHDKDGSLELTAEGERLLLSHREEYLHGHILHSDNSPLPEGVFQHWTSCHHIDKVTLREFYDRLRAMPYHIEDLIPLTEVQIGKAVEVALIVGGRNAINRLCEMGLTPETRLTVSKRAPAGGPLIISVRSTDVAIGRGIASKILVKVIG